MSEIRPRPRRRNRLIAFAVLAVVAASSGYLLYASSSNSGSDTHYVTEQVSRGTLTVAVAGNGSLVSDQSAAVDPSVSGTVSQLDVAAGERVSEGDVLFVIMNPDLDAAVAQAKAQYRAAQSAVLKAAQARDLAQEQRTAGIALAKAQYLQAKSARIKARQAYDIAAAGTDSMATEAARASWQAAVASEQSAEESYDDAVPNAQVEYAIALGAFEAASSARESARLALDVGTANAERRTVRAPISGYVTALSLQNGDQLGTGSRAAAQTDGASASAPVVISDLSSLHAQVRIAEGDRLKVRRGQKVSLTFDALPSLTASGEVVAIDAVGTSDLNVVTYGVSVELDEQDARLSPGMTTSASIITSTEPAVLLAPSAAIHPKASGSSVLVLNKGERTPQETAVTTGSVNDTQTVIVSGLEEGAAVVVQTIESGAGSKPAAQSGLSALGGAARAPGGFGEAK